MSTFGELQTQILDDLDRDDLTAQVQLAIKNAVKFHNENNIFWFQEERAETTLVADQEYVQLPSDFDSLDVLSITEDSFTYVLTPRSTEFIEEYTRPDRTSRPAHYNLYDDQIRLFPIPDETLTLNLHYKRNLAEVTATAAYTSNWFTDGYLLIRHRATFDVFENTLHESERAAPHKQQEGEALDGLYLRNHRRTASGRLKKHL